MAVRAINASRFAEILEQWKKDCLQDNDQQSADVISDVILQLDDMPTLTPPNEWVSVEEKKPKYNIREDGELVSSKILCYCETDKTVHLAVSQKFYTARKGEIVHPVFRYYDEWGDEIEDVSHWMPLPESPKEDE